MKRVIPRKLAKTSPLSQHFCRVLLWAFLHRSWNPSHPVAWKKPVMLEVSKFKFHTLKRRKKVDHFDANRQLLWCFIEMLCEVVICKFNVPENSSLHPPKQAQQQQKPKKMDKLHDFSPMFFHRFDLAKNAMFYRITLIPWLGTVADWNLEQNPSCWTEPWLNFVRHWIYSPPGCQWHRMFQVIILMGFPLIIWVVHISSGGGGIDPSYAISLGEIFEVFSPKFQLMITWIELVVWDSNRVPSSNKTFHNWIPNIQTTKPNHQLAISWKLFLMKK